MKCVILETSTTDYNDVSWHAVDQVVSNQRYAYTFDEDVEDRAAQADIVIVNKHIVGEEFLAKVPRCKCIMVFATGYDGIDVPLCTSKGIYVYNVKDYSAFSVAQHVMATIFQHVHRLGHYYNGVASGKWSSIPVFSYVDHTIRELSSIQLGILGLGSIGHCVYNMADSLGVQIKVHTRTQYQSDVKTGIQYCSLKELFQYSDFLSLHVPLNEQTIHMIDASLLSYMKSDAVLINTARGAIMNIADLKNHLSSNPDFFAYIDTLDQEPPAHDHPLIGMSNCRITPHLAWCSQQSRQRLIDFTAANIEDFLTDKKLAINAEELTKS